jgi:hypothetical protein
VRPLSALFLGFLAFAYGGAANAQLSDNLVRIGVLGIYPGFTPTLAARATLLPRVWPLKTPAAKC